MVFRWIVFSAFLAVLGCASTPFVLSLDEMHWDGVPKEPIRQIALSFDDAPRGDGPMFSADDRAATLLAALDEADTGPVVFFVTTRGFARPGARARARVERYADAGHLIANHTHSHPWGSRTDTDDYIADIDRAAAELDGFANARPWFRFPYLDEGRPVEKRDAYRAALAERGLINGYVTIDNYDWYIESQWQRAVNDGAAVNLDAVRDVYVEMILEAAAFYDEAAIDVFDRSPVHVLLLHENDVAAMFIDDAVAALRADGWDIVSPDMAYADPIAALVPQTLFTNQGHIAALANEAGRSRRTFDHWAITESEIDARLAAAGAFSASGE